MISCQNKQDTSKRLTFFVWTKTKTALERQVSWLSCMENCIVAFRFLCWITSGLSARTSNFWGIVAQINPKAECITANQFPGFSSGCFCVQKLLAGQSLLILGWSISLSVLGHLVIWTKGQEIMNTQVSLTYETSMAFGLFSPNFHVHCKTVCSRFKLHQQVAIHSNKMQNPGLNTESIFFFSLSQMTNLCSHWDEHHGETVGHSRCHKSHEDSLRRRLGGQTEPSLHNVHPHRLRHRGEYEAVRGWTHQLLVSCTLHWQPRGLHQQSLLGRQYLLRAFNPKTVAGKTRTQAGHQLLPMGSAVTVVPSHDVLPAVHDLEISQQQSWSGSQQPDWSRFGTAAHGLCWDQGKDNPLRDQESGPLLWCYARISQRLFHKLQALFVSQLLSSVRKPIRKLPGFSVSRRKTALHRQLRRTGVYVKCLPDNWLSCVRISNPSQADP